MEDGISSGNDSKMSRVIKKDLRSAEEINRLAMSELKENYDRAKKYFELNVKRNPTYITYNNLAWYYFKNEELSPFKKSTKYCMKALQLKTNLSSLRLLRDILYLRKECDKAKDIQEHIFESFESDQNNYIDDCYFMGCIFMRMRCYESAEKYLKIAYDYYCSHKTFEYDEVVVAFAICLAKIGKYDEANKIGDYISVDPFDLLYKLMVYYYTNNFEKIKDYIEELQQEWAIQDDVLAIILLTYKHYYSEEEVEKKYINIIERVKKGCNPGWRRKDLVPLKKVYEQINLGIKPELKYEPLRYFISNYIDFN